MVTRAGGRIWTYALGAVLLVAIAVAAVLWWPAGNDEGAPAPTTPATGMAFPTPTGTVASVDPVAPFTQADADRITAALTGSDAAAAAAVLVPELRDPVTAAGGELLPAGSTVTLLNDRFVAIEPALGSVPLLVRGEEPANLLLILAHADGQWLVVSTEEVQ